MVFSQKYNNALTGVISGIVMPAAAFLIFFMLTRHGLTLALFIRRMIEVDNVTEILSVSVFANILIFLLFNRFDMLRASKGVLGITIVWAFIVFGIKLL